MIMKDYRGIARGLLCIDGGFRRLPEDNEGLLEKNGGLPEDNDALLENKEEWLENIEGLLEDN